MPKVGSSASNAAAGRARPAMFHVRTCSRKLRREDEGEKSKGCVKWQNEKGQRIDKKMKKLK